MNRPDLHQHLLRLHSELQRAEGMDERTRALLRDLSQDIENILEAPDDTAHRERSRTLRDRLSTALQQFEAAHPDLARTTNNVLETLAIYNL